MDPFLFPSVPREYDRRADSIVAKLAVPMVAAAVKGGRMLTDMWEKGERERGGGSRSPSHGERVIPTLKDLGFSFSRASRWTTAGLVPDETLQELRESCLESARVIFLPRAP
jgi:hypothetical protein